jgi:hypothetical protein
VLFDGLGSAHQGAYSNGGIALMASFVAPASTSLPSAWLN